MNSQGSVEFTANSFAAAIAHLAIRPCIDLHARDGRFDILYHPQADVANVDVAPEDANDLALARRLNSTVAGACRVVRID